MPKVPFEEETSTPPMLERLVKQARAATKGPWEVRWRDKDDGGETYCVSHIKALFPDVAFTNRYAQGYENAAYIAMLDPEIVQVFIRAAQLGLELMEMIDKGDDIELSDYNEEANAVMTELHNVCRWLGNQ